MFFVGGYIGVFHFLQYIGAGNNTDCSDDGNSDFGAYCRADSNTYSYTYAYTGADAGTGTDGDVKFCRRFAHA